MPKMDGYEMCSKICDLVDNQNYQLPYIVALSSSQGLKHERICF
jgi:CheY-like chemotaxis protein